MRMRFLLFLLIASFLPNAQATIMRLDFSGTFVGSFPFNGGDPLGEYSGYYLLDTSLLDSDDSPTISRFGPAVIEGALYFNDMTIDLSIGVNIAGVNNDSTGFDDLFFVLSGELNNSLAFTLRDSSRSVFSDDSFPTQLLLSDFDLFEIDNVNSTGVFAFINGQSVQGSIDYLSYTAVPIPGAIILFASGLLGFGVVSKKASLSDL